MPGRARDATAAAVLWPGAMLAFVAGHALQLAQPMLWAWQAYAICVLAGLLALPLAARGMHRSGARGLAPGAVPLFAAAALAAFGHVGWRASAFQAQAMDPTLEGRDLLLRGVVAAMPRMDAQGVRWVFDVESARDAEGPVQVPPRVSLGWYGVPDEAPGIWSLDAAAATPALAAGERWELGARLRAPHGNLNPHGFDFELWAWEQGIQATGTVRPGPGREPPRRLASTGWHPVERARQAVRERVQAQLREQGRAAGWITALVTGEQAAIEQADWDVFRATGVAHLMSISGLHITMFAWLASALVGALWRRSAFLCLRWPAPQAALLGGVLLAGAYALFSGWAVPAQRTLCMLAVAALLRAHGRQWPWPIVWLAACCAVLARDPWALLQPGFWLSFVAVGVLFAAAPETPGGGDRSAWARLRAAWHEQWTITLALTPLGLLLFGQVSLVGLAANALAIPWVTLLLTPLAMLGVLWSPLWLLAAWAAEGLASVLQWLAGLSFAQYTAALAPAWVGAAAVVGGVLLVLRLPAAFRLIGLPLVLPILLWQAPRPAEGGFELLAADVGQGSAVLLRTARHALLYDTGPAFANGDDAGRRTMLPLLRALDERLDVLVVSHRDTDHAGGAAALRLAQPQALLRSSVEPSHPLWRLGPGERCTAGQRWEWDGVHFELLHPPAGDAAGVKPNALSCVLRVRGRGATALLAGDIEAPTEQALVEAGAPLQADWLLVPHHGSKTSSSAAFLDAVRPRVAVVQAGYRNRFGHPAAAPLARLRERGASVLDSAHCGAIRWESGRPAQAGCLRRDARRYWWHEPP